jgi:hypothetical protein
LHAAEAGGQLQLYWDHAADVAAPGKAATLEISDGAVKKTVSISAKQLKSGSLTWVRRSDQVNATLTVETPGGGKQQSTTTFLGRAPEAKEAKEPKTVVVESAASKRQRDDMAKEVARLKTQLAASQDRTRKAEKDLENARQQFRRDQERRRLNNQTSAP